MSGHTDEHHRVACLHTKEESLDESREQERRAEAEHETNHRQQHALPDDHVLDVAGRGAERQTDADFLRALLDGIRHQP